MGATGLVIKSLSIGNNFTSAKIDFYGDTRPSRCSTNDPTSVEIKNHGPYWE